MTQRWINRALDAAEKGAAMILEILLVIDLFLWFLALLPVPQAVPFNWATSWLAWIAVLLITLIIFVPGLRGV